MREGLYKKFADKGFKVGAEIGVYTGTNAKNMFSIIPGLKLYLVDPWNQKKRHNPLRAYRMVRRLAAKYDAVIMRKKSEQAAPLVQDGSLDFVYIDGDHCYDSAMLDIILWNRKVREGGIVSGHDYYKRGKFGVRNAVDDYVRYHKLELILSSGKNWHWEK